MKSFRTPYSVVFLIAIGLGMSSCGKELERDVLGNNNQGLNNTGNTSGGTGGGTNALTQLDLFKQNKITQGIDKLDILFVVDSSGSLIDERHDVAEGIVQFIDALPSNTNYQIGMILGHVGARAGRLYKRSTEPTVLKSSELSKAQIQTHFRFKMDSIPEEGPSDGGEFNFYSLMKAFEPTQIDESVNLGFFRENAALAVIFISDEDEPCARYLTTDIAGKPIHFVVDGDNNEVPGYVNYCTKNNINTINHSSVRARLRDIQGDYPLILASIIYKTGGNPVPQGGENEIGYGYEELMKLGFGTVVDLADPAPDADPIRPNPGRIASGLKVIGDMAAERLILKKEFKLSKDNVSKIVSVKVDGKDVTFVYDPLNNEVHIDNAGKSESLIEIAYEYSN